MAVKAFKKTNSQNQDVSDLSRNVAEYTDQLTKIPLLDGQLLQDVVINTAAAIPHSLGRPWKGYIIVNKDAAANVYTTNKSNSQYTLNLTSTAHVKVDIWVF